MATLRLINPSSNKFSNSKGADADQDCLGAHLYPRRPQRIRILFKVHDCLPTQEMSDDKIFTIPIFVFECQAIILKSEKSR